MPTDTAPKRPTRHGLIATLADSAGLLLLLSPVIALGILYILVS
jgi:hypothetical protein